VRLAEHDRDSALEVGQLTLQTPKGPVKLSDVAELVRDEGPQVIEREDRSRQIQVWAAPRGRRSGIS
jgi:Cu/Ag efflux pump CusA